MASFFDIHNGYQNKQPPPWLPLETCFVSSFSSLDGYLRLWVFSCCYLTFLFKKKLPSDSIKKTSHPKMFNHRIPSFLAKILPFSILATRRSGFVDDANREAPHLGGSICCGSAEAKAAPPGRPVGPWQLLRWTRCTKK